MNLRDTIGSILLFAFVGALGLMFWVTVPPDNKDLITYMLGQLSGFVGGVVAAHYTINAGQQKLDEKKSENTAKAFDAITATANASAATSDSAVIHDGDAVTVFKAPDDV